MVRMPANDSCPGSGFTYRTALDEPPSGTASKVAAVVLLGSRACPTPIRWQSREQLPHLASELEE